MSSLLKIERKIYPAVRRLRRFQIGAALLFGCLLTLVVAQTALANPSAAVLALQIEPTTDPCGPPTLTAGSAAVNVRTGPGTEYAVFQSIRSDSTYPVIGRAETRRYWVIALTEDQPGWVFADIVDVSGNIADVPLVDPPLVNGEPPAPVGPWVPESLTPPCTEQPVTVAPVAPTPVSEVSATMDSGEFAPWSVPFNLSVSGAATEPRMVVDNGGVVHIMWRDDAAAQFYYSRLENGMWRAPVPVNVPFARREGNSPARLYDPQLIADSQGRVHAFWIGADSALLYSSASAIELAAADPWAEPRQLGQSALAFSVAVDSVDRLHLGYVRNLESEDAPAGIYYRQLSPSDAEWRGAVPIYLSNYFRAVPQAEANIHLATVTRGTAEDVLIAWDNRPLELVFLARSGDGGGTWDSPQVIDARQTSDAPGAPGPRNIVLVAADGRVHLAWIDGDGETCLQHQWSEDGGVSWRGPQPVSVVTGVCPTTFAYLAGADQLLLLHAEVNEAHYLLAWAGTTWSKAERQQPLSGFEDGVTFRPVTLDCLQFVVVENDLLAVGCGLSGVNDIWILERPAGTEATWFADTETVTWSDPEILHSSPSLLSSPVLVATDDGELHAFWLESSTLPADNASIVLYHAALTDDSWSLAIPLFKLPTSSADALSVASSGDLIFIAWRDYQTNTFWSSRVDSERVRLPGDWAEPTALPVPKDVLGKPVLYTDLTGAVNLLYAVPLNEGRGIFLLRSPDSMATWSARLVVADAVAEGWVMVGDPHITQTADGHLHVLWTVSDFAPDPVPRGLYYARSTDGGSSWTRPVELGAGAPGWSGMVARDEETVVVTWERVGNTGRQVWSQQSFDSGTTWNSPSLILGVDLAEAAVVMIGEDTDQLQIAQLAIDQNGDLLIQKSAWLEMGWQAAARSVLPETDFVGLGNQPVAELTIDGRQTIAFVSETAAVGSEELLNSLLATTLRLEVSVSPLAPLPPGEMPSPATATAVPPEIANPGTDLPTPTVTSQNTAPITSEAAGPGTESTTLTSLLLIALLPVILIVAVVIFVRLRRSRMPGY